MSKVITVGGFVTEATRDKLAQFYLQVVEFENYGELRAEFLYSAHEARLAEIDPLELRVRLLYQQDGDCHERVNLTGDLLILDELQINDDHLVAVLRYHYPRKLN